MAAHVSRRVERLKALASLDDLAALPLFARVPRPFELAAGARVCEVRFADETGGFLVPKEKAVAAEAARLAREAAAAGAFAVAVWVERNFHAGDWEHLEAVRAALPDAVLLARDVVVDPWQLARARAAGADGIELLPELLGPLTDAFAASARGLGLTPLVWRDGVPVVLPEP
jgi:hypothetical protein